MSWRKAGQQLQRHLIRLLRWLFGGLSLLIIGFSTWLAWHWVFPPETVNILIVGVDSRFESDYTNPADLIIVISINAQNRALNILSLPRDVFIPVEGFGIQRLASVHFLGETESTLRGINLLREVLEQNLGIKIDYYVRMNFDGFVKLIDSLGGLEIDVPSDLSDVYKTSSGETQTLSFQEGTELMNGERSLAYARIRRSDGIEHRFERHQQIISMFITKIFTPMQMVKSLSLWNNIEAYTNNDINLYDLFEMAPSILLYHGNLNYYLLGEDDLIFIRPNYVTINYPHAMQWILENFE
jgi:LCP family protein required for cell wall assembly